MKTTTSCRRFFHSALVTALAIVITCGLSLRPAQGYIVRLEQVGPDVVATGSGPIDLTGLFFLGSAPVSGAPGSMNPTRAFISTGPTNIFADGYSGSFSEPTSFGSGPVALASSGSGDYVQSPIATILFVPQGYVSGGPLSDSSTYNNATFSTLGVIPGTYVWSWGSGVNQNLTLQIGAAGVPDSGSTFGLLMVSFVGLFGITRFRSLRLT